MADDASSDRYPETAETGDDPPPTPDLLVLINEDIGAINGYRCCQKSSVVDDL